MDEPILRPRPAMAMPTSSDASMVPAVSWGAIFAGAAGAAALSLILLVLGVGLGMSAVSPWSARGITAETFGVTTIVWISFTALVASGVGGYLAGRLRSRWIGTHLDEVYFRDTAHGFLAWAVATLVAAGLLTSAIGSVASAGAQTGGAAFGAVGSAGMAAAVGAGATMSAPNGSGGARSPDSMGYFVDSLFRQAPSTQAPADSGSAPTAAAAPAVGASGPSPAPEVGRILARSMQGGSLSSEDSQYVAQMVAQRTGMSPQDAQKRVADVYGKAQAAIQDAEAKAKEAADKARQATAYGSIWLFFSLLLGAFAASLMATFGGRRRDL